MMKHLVLDTDFFLESVRIAILKNFKHCQVMS